MAEPEVADPQDLHDGEDSSEHDASGKSQSLSHHSNFSAASLTAPMFLATELKVVKGSYRCHCGGI